MTNLRPYTVHIGLLSTAAHLIPSYWDSVTDLDSWEEWGEPRPGNSLVTHYQIRTYNPDELVEAINSLPLVDALIPMQDGVVAVRTDTDVWANNQHSYKPFHTTSLVEV